MNTLMVKADSEIALTMVGDDAPRYIANVLADAKPQNVISLNFNRTTRSLQLIVNTGKRMDYMYRGDITEIIDKGHNMLLEALMSQD